jgi:hypothetical protein
MEVAMTRIVLRHSISVLAALALISVFAASPVSAQQVFLDEIVVTAKKREKVEPEGSPVIFDHSGLITQGTMNPNTPKGLTTKKSPQASIISGFNSLER